MAEHLFITRLTDAQIEQLHALYQQTWWSTGRSLETARAIVAGSDLVFGIEHGDTGELIGFARVLTDGVIKAFIFDVIVDERFRHARLGSRLMDAIVNHPQLSGVKHLELYCRPEMVDYYRRFGFSADFPEAVFMRRDRQPV